MDFMTLVRGFMTKPLENTLYIVSAVFFILGLKMLGKASTAKKGNFLSAIGMLIATVTAVVAMLNINIIWVLVGIILGSFVGVISAKKVAMTSMPEMVALFNGLGGAASLLVAWAEYQMYVSQNSVYSTPVAKLAIVIVTILIGAVTFTGSLVAWAKLSGKITSKPIKYAGQGIVNTILILAFVAAAVAFSGKYYFGAIQSYELFGIATVLSLIIGITYVIPIGGGDMPVVISLLNAFSGMAACAAGFVISNTVLIVTGALVGSSGIILTNIMCRAMNRSITNVLFSGFGNAGAKKASGAAHGEAKPISVDDAYLMLESAGSVLIVPGYGMAVAQAQHAVQELAAQLEENGTEVNFAIHPVAGRMPGHMNVLLAEANVPYEQLKEMDDVNPTIENVDVCVVIGANDVINPAAREDKSSPIYGMPVINVDKAKNVIVLKRSMNTGFAGIENPLFFKENTRMLFGDAKQTVQDLVAQFKD